MPYIFGIYWLLCLHGSFLIRCYPCKAWIFHHLSGKLSLNLFVNQNCFGIIKSSLRNWSSISAFCVWEANFKCEQPARRRGKPLIRGYLKFRLKSHCLFWRWFVRPNCLHDLEWQQGPIVLAQVWEADSVFDSNFECEHPAQVSKSDPLIRLSWPLMCSCSGAIRLIGI